MDEIEGIRWEEINIDTGLNRQTKKQSAYPQPLEGSYANLFEELQYKCNPQRFMVPYDHEKVSIANKLYGKVLENKTDEDILRVLRAEAMEKLGLKFSTLNLYNNLLKKANPDNFMTPYDGKKVSIANKYYHEIMKHADDIVALEDIENQMKSEDTFQNVVLGGPLNTPITDSDLIGAVVVIFTLLISFFLLFLFQ
ncbi:MAG: hypothetical protein IJM43_07635 [Bacteroidaceae bacterium]|nr:hypothetical protein [Bacteroidaceae bacterium]